VPASSESISASKPLGRGLPARPARQARGGPPIEIDLASAGFDALDFQDAINFTFPVSLPGL
jgi:hypothetical protein